MRMPVYVIDDTRELNIFSSLDDIKHEIEPQFLLEPPYRVYDADGHLWQPVVVPKKRSAPRGLFALFDQVFTFITRCIPFEGVDPYPDLEYRQVADCSSHTRELRSALRRHFLKAGHTRQSLRDLPLASLVELSKEYVYVERVTQPNPAGALRVLVCFVMASLGGIFFRRIATGQLFLFALPWETAPSDRELQNAKELGEWLLLSPIPISAGIWLFLTFCRFKPFEGLSRRNVLGIALVVLQLLALVVTFLDCWSTVLLVSRFGVDGEVHPGIASFCYMFGRTVGAAIGKIFQWVCMQFIVAAVSVRWRIVILSIFIVAGGLAGLWNFGQVMELMDVG